MRQLPIGVQDFKAVRDSDKYYVDKSMLIAQMLEQNDNGVFLYTRPRRFGKSLNLSMMDAFFNMEYKGNKWFDGLKISEYPEFDRYRNAFPVISVDMRVDSVADFEDFVDAFNFKLRHVFGRFTYLLDSERLDEVSKRSFMDAYSGNIRVRGSMSALFDLSTFLEKHHGMKVIVLMDEYDNVVNSIPDPDLRRKILDFFRGVMSPLFKGNDSLQFGVVTGVTQITKENIFSGLNNLYVNNILSEDYDEMFGFTDDEVRQICEDYGHPEKFEEAKDWYDGYRFGEADIYNPWSILNYIQKKFKPASYWVNTSGNDIIRDLLDRAGPDILNEMENLGSGGSILCNVTPSLTFEDLGKKNAIYSLMAISGYLKAVPEGSRYALSIPNRELYHVFADMISDYIFDDTNPITYISDFSDAILSGDTDAMEKALYEIIEMSVSSSVLDNEHSYQMLLTGMMMGMSGRYRITADMEKGRGYYDIRVERLSGRGCNAVIEIKRVKSDNDLRSAAEDALKQIREKDYAHGLEGETILYGIAFCDKVPYIISERL